MHNPFPVSVGYPYLFIPLLGDSGALALYPSSSLQPDNARVCEKVPHELPEVVSLLVASSILRLLAAYRLLKGSDGEAALTILVGGPTAMGQLMAVSRQV